MEHNQRGVFCLGIVDGTFDITRQTIVNHTLNRDDVDRAFAESLFKSKWLRLTILSLDRGRHHQEGN